MVISGYFFIFAEDFKKRMVLGILALLSKVYHLNINITIVTI